MFCKLKSKKKTNNQVDFGTAVLIYWFDSVFDDFDRYKIFIIKSNNGKKENRNEVLFLSLTVSLVTSLSSFHSFMVQQELILNNSIVGSLGFYMVSP